MQKADISIFESIGRHEGSCVSVNNERKSVQNFDAFLPLLAVPTVTKAINYVKDGKNLKELVKSTVAAAGATVASLGGSPVPPENIKTTLETYTPEKLKKAGDKVIKHLDKLMKGIEQDLSENKKLIGPVVVAYLIHRGYTSEQQALSLVRDASSITSFPILLGALKSSLSVKTALEFAMNLSSKRV